jgi:hypothetical protein
MINRKLILEMFNQMDDSFKKRHEIEVKNMLKTYPCVCLMKGDLIGYAENEYKADSETISQLVRYIEDELDDSDMQNIADDFTNDSVMFSFWYSVEYQLDLMCEKIGCYGKYKET